MISTDTPIEKIQGIGPILRMRLKKMGIKNAHDFLRYFPIRYQNFSNFLPISQLKINEICTIEGKIIDIKNTRTWKRKMFITEALIEDKTGAIKAVWFNQPFLTRNLKKEQDYFFSGKVVLSKNGAYLSNPVYEREYIEEQSTHTGRLVPVYPETKGLSSRWIRAVIKFILTDLKGRLLETLPEEIIKENGFLNIESALWQAHFPDSEKTAEQAKKRFSFEEIFYIQLFVLREKAKLSKEKAIALPMNIELIKKFVDSLPFKLTDGQKKSAYQILKDLEKPRPMNRLLEGDVGSGKTVVAAIAILNIVKQGYQAALMAPTEILATQHFNTVFSLLKNFNLNIGILTGKKDRFYSKKLKTDFIEISRKKILEKTLKNEINILIGTHALIQDKVKFGNLALVVLDEQHRFGVEQRAKLSRSKPPLIIPHLLSMTATPIPRTLALTIYGDLDLSIIDQLPKGRKKIETKIVEPKDRQKAYEFIRKEVEKGRQIFVICPRIEKPETDGKKDIFKWSEAKAVKEEYEKLSKNIFPDLKVAQLHGKIKGTEKEKIMKDFKNKKIDILVSTSVVEVGVDIPNASVMMIEGSEHFGLAQLHQFRGRVGRGEHQSYCLLFTESDSIKTKERLKALTECENGFALAEKDLQIRGPGDFIGVKQWGMPDFMMSSLKDLELVQKTKESARNLLMQDPYLKRHPLILERLKGFRERVHLE